MPKPKPKPKPKRSRARRVGESAFGLLLLLGRAVAAVVVLVLLAAGVRTSWGTAQHVLLNGREQGTVTAASCGEDVCRGRFVPELEGGRERTVRIDASQVRRDGGEVDVAVVPGSDEVVRTGWGGGLHAWTPLGGALLLASPVMAGGLGLRRTAWAAAGAGLALLGAAFLLL
ncbi:hypothetical protein ACFW9F_27320 [Streptomyces sp. NPDC059506]|uniref:hypothetical protein n=1 Tax=Streptomyces sp. NPDC059506 TaxID=3347751 RepID=UPI0036C681C8